MQKEKWPNEWLAKESFLVFQILGKTFLILDSLSMISLVINIDDDRSTHIRHGVLIGVILAVSKHLKKTRQWNEDIRRKAMLDVMERSKVSSGS